jgi:hypothetical protein
LSEKVASAFVVFTLKLTQTAADTTSSAAPQHLRSARNFFGPATPNDARGPFFLLDEAFAFVP